MATKETPDYKFLTLVIPPELKQALRVYAAKQSMSMSEAVRLIVTEYVTHNLPISKQK